MGRNTEDVGDARLMDSLFRLSTLQRRRTSSAQCPWALCCPFFLHVFVLIWEVAIPIVCPSDTLRTNLRMYPTKCIYVGISSQSYPGDTLSSHFCVATDKRQEPGNIYSSNKKVSSTYVQGLAINRPFQPWQDSTSLIIAAVAALEQEQ